MNAVKGDSFVTLEWEFYCCCCCRALFAYCFNRASLFAPSQLHSDLIPQNGCVEEFASTQRGREAPAGRHSCSSGREEAGSRNAVCGWGVSFLQHQCCVHVPCVSYSRRHMCTHLVIYLCIDSINKHILWLVRVVDSLRKVLR